MDSQSQDMRDKTRLCPACRMAISALATKCRYCGEQVNRPMAEEVRRLSVSDLGGGDTTQKTLNESVVDALDAFRREELARAATERQQQEEELSKSWFGRKKPADKSHGATDDMPELDPRNVELSQISLAPSRPKAGRKRPDRLWTKKLALGASFVAAVVLLYLGGGFVKAHIDRYLTHGSAKHEASSENPAAALLTQPGRALDALSAAVQAMHDAPGGGDNRRILDTARDHLVKDVEALLQADPWTMAKLDKASALVAQASAIDPDGVPIKDLKKAVEAEVFSYKMTITSVDAANGSAMIRIVYPDRPPDVVFKKKDEVVNGRFKVKRIGSMGVTFEDPQRVNAAGLPRTFTVSLDGNISVQ